MFADVHHLPGSLFNLELGKVPPSPEHPRPPLLSYVHGQGTSGCYLLISWMRTHKKHILTFYRLIVIWGPKGSSWWNDELQFIEHKRNEANTGKCKIPEFVLSVPC